MKINRKGAPTAAFQFHGRKAREFALRRPWRRACVGGRDDRGRPFRHERGKRGGARVVDYCHSDAMPIFALTAYAKNQRADLSQADRNDFRRLTRAPGRALFEENAMTSKVAESIRRGLEEALAYAEGAADASRYGIHVPADIDVKAIRTRLNLTQEEFAGRFGFSINTLRHWEQGRRVPEGLTRAYLLVIDRNPKAVQKALRAA